MEVSIQQLLETIGEQTVQIKMLEQQVRSLQAGSVIPAPVDSPERVPVAVNGTDEVPN